MIMARMCHLNVGADDRLDRDQVMALEAKCDEVYSSGKPPQMPAAPKPQPAPRPAPAPVPRPEPKPAPRPAYSSQKISQRSPKPLSEEEMRQASQQAMDKLVQENYIFVDLSSLLAPESLQAMSNLVPLLEKYGKKLFIPDSVMRLLKQKSADASDPQQAKFCADYYDALCRMVKVGRAQIRTFNAGDSTPAQDLLTACAHFRIKYPLLVLTQDTRLAKDLLMLNRQNSASGKNITVKRVNKHGFLSNVIDTTPVKTVRTVRQEPDRQLPVSVFPQSGDCVYDNLQGMGPILLDSEIGSGGEGTIYSTNTPYVAKIYKPECCTAHRQEKIMKMIKAGLQYEGICFPISMLYNQYGEFVGYLMMKAKGHSIQSSIFRKPLFLNKFPGWDKEDLIQTAITILYKIKYLHDKGVIMGDINPNNILVVSPLEVYFVDTDSYQIDDLPCPVGFPLFTAPEIHQMHRDGKVSGYTDLLRTRQQEYYAVATLIFMLMLPGKPPYTHAGGEDIVDNILQMHFPYALGEQRGVHVPDGTWRFMWSHLTRRMKEKFHQTFGKDEGKSQFNARERLNVEQWIDEMTIYRQAIQRWKMEYDANRPQLEAMRANVEQLRQRHDPRWEAADRERKVFEFSLPDPMSSMLYPSRLKRLPDTIYEPCIGEGCNREYPEGDRRLRGGYCPECQKKGEKVKCVICDDEFVFTNYEKSKGFNRPNMCPECRRKKDETDYEAPCATPGCFNQVKLTRAAVAYYKANNKQLPDLCPDCRKRLMRTSSRSAYNGARQQVTRPPVSQPAAPKPAAQPVVPKPVAKPVPPRSQAEQAAQKTTGNKMGFFEYMRSLFE